MDILKSTSVAVADITSSQTMSSLEIAELTGKRHDNVMEDIRKMLKELDVRSPDFSGEQTFANNRKREIFNLPKDLTITLVSGYNVVMRHRIVTRWQELEAKAALPHPAFAIPQNLSEALRLAADLADDKARLEAKLTEMKPSVAALERLTKADGSLCITDAAKQLQTTPKRLFALLSVEGWIYRRQGTSWIAYQEKIQAGLLEHKLTVVERTDGTEKTVSQVRITPKGIAKVGKMLESLEAAA